MSEQPSGSGEYTPSVFNTGFRGMDFQILPIALGDQTVTLKGSPDKLAARAGQLKLMAELVQPIPEAHAPRTISASSNELKLERANGINLCDTSFSSFGPDIEASVGGSTQAVALKNDYRRHTYAFFEHIPIEKRLRAAATYLRVADAMHKRGLHIGDHKRDSIFVSPEGHLTLTDFGNFDSEKGSTAAQLWQLDQKSPVPNSFINPNYNSLTATLAAFMNRDLEVHPPFSSDDRSQAFDNALPVGYHTILRILDGGSYASAAEAADEIESWLKGVGLLSPPAEDSADYIAAKLATPEYWENNIRMNGEYVQRYFPRFLIDAMQQEIASLKKNGQFNNLTMDILKAKYTQLAWQTYDKTVHK